jgi:hypothetical protein
MDAVQEKKPTELVVETGPYSKRGTELPARRAADEPDAGARHRRGRSAHGRRQGEGLFAMHKEMMDREASQAFNDAMARAQANIQPIAKNRRNDHTKSMYATLAAINDAITPIYTAEGLSVSFDTYSTERDKDLPPLDAGKVRVIAFCSHRGGHTRKYHLDGALDDAGKDGTKNKTGIQAMGSTVSYLRRYLVCMIFNVATADDNDGNGGGAGNRMDEKTLGKHLDMINGSEAEADVLKNFAKAYNEAEELKDKDAQRQFLGARDNRRKELAKGRRA